MGLLSAIASPFLSQVFIAINVDSTSCIVKVLRLKRGEIIASVTREFTTTVDNTIPMEAVKLIRNYKRKYPLTYVSAMMKSLSQGIVLQDASALLSSECEVRRSNTLSVFAHKAMIKEHIRNYYASIEVDFLFSPFFLIDHNVQDLPTLGNNVYVLLQRSNVAIMIVHRGVATFGGFFIAEGEVPSLNKEEKRIELELKSFDDFSLEEDFDEFAKIALNPSLDRLQTDMFIPNLNDTFIPDDMPKAKIISKILLDAMHEYYQNPLYHGAFIDKVILLDACRLSDQAYELIAKEVMLETVKRDFRLHDILISFARSEVAG